MAPHMYHIYAYMQMIAASKSKGVHAIYGLYGYRPVAGLLPVNAGDDGWFCSVGLRWRQQRRTALRSTIPSSGRRLVKRWKPETGLALNAVRHGFVITSNCGKYKNRLLYNAWMVPHNAEAPNDGIKAACHTDNTVIRRSVAAGNHKLFKLSTFQHFSNCLFARYNIRIRLMDAWLVQWSNWRTTSGADNGNGLIGSSLWSPDYRQRTLFYFNWFSSLAAKSQARAPQKKKKTN